MPIVNGRFEALQQSAVRWKNRLKQAAAVCNGLTMISKTHVVGDDMDRKMFRIVEAHFLVGVCLLYSPSCASLPHALCCLHQFRSLKPDYFKGAACLHDIIKLVTQADALLDNWAGWLQDRQTVVLPRQPDHASKQHTAKLHMLRVFEFNSRP